MTIVEAAPLKAPFGRSANLSKHGNSHQRYMCAGAFAVILQQLNCSLGYVYEIMGVLIGSAVGPIAMCLMWRKTNKWGAIAGAFGGQWLGLVAWVLFAKVRHTGLTPLKGDLPGQNIDEGC